MQKKINYLQKSGSPLALIKRWTAELLNSNFTNYNNWSSLNHYHLGLSKEINGFLDCCIFNIKQKIINLESKGFDEKQSSSLSNYYDFLSIVFSKDWYKNKNYATALNYIEKSLAFGSQNALIQKARILLKKDYLKRDPLESFKIFRFLADNGNTTAKMSLGLSYLLGVGCKIDHTKALEIFEHLHSYDGLAITNLAMMYNQGIACEADINKATELFGIAIDSGDVNAMTCLAMILLKKDGSDLEAHQYLYYASLSGNTTAMLQLAEIYKKTNIPKAIALLEHHFLILVSSNSNDHFEKYMLMMKVMLNQGQGKTFKEKLVAELWHFLEGGKVLSDNTMAFLEQSCQQELLQQLLSKENKLSTNLVFLNQLLNKKVSSYSFLKTLFDKSSVKPHVLGELLHLKSNKNKNYQILKQHIETIVQDRRNLYYLQKFSKLPANIVGLIRKQMHGRFANQQKNGLKGEIDTTKYKIIEFLNKNLAITPSILKLPHLRIVLRNIDRNYYKNESMVIPVAFKILCVLKDLKTKSFETPQGFANTRNISFEVLLQRITRALFNKGNAQIKLSN